MMLTEKEAAQRWCPFACVLDTSRSGAQPYNRLHVSRDVLDSTPATCRCIGSRCMAWRWDSEPFNSPRGGCGLVPRTGGAA